MTADTSRRSLLAGLTIAPVAFAPAAIAAPSGGSQELHALWNKRRAMRSIYLESRDRIDAAEAALPWWAQTGPKYLTHEGKFKGERAGWPAIRDMQPSDRPGVLRLVRPSPHDFREKYEQNCRLWGSSNLPRFRASYRAQLRGLAVRRREQKAEEEKLGLPALERRHDAIMDEMSAIVKAIEALPDRTPDAVAASLMIELNYEADTRDTTGCNIQGIGGALRIMLPSLTGNIAADAADLLDNPDTPITERKAWIG